jgi:hypothetical protein
MVATRSIIDIVDDADATPGRKCPNKPRADAAGAARDENDLAGEVHAVSPDAIGG